MSHNLALLSPLIIVACCGLVVMLAGVFTPKEQSKGYLAYLTVLGNLVAALIVGWLFAKGGAPFAGNTEFLESMLVLNRYSLFFSMVVLVVSSAVALLSARYAEEAGCSFGEYYSLLNFATMGMLVLVQSNNLVSLFLGLEVMSISSYVLAGIRRRYLRSAEASMKYFIMGAFASALLLYGLAMLYGMTGETNLHRIHYVLFELKGAASFSEPMLLAALGLLMAAFGFKVAAVPFHMWAPDVYEGAPTPITAFFAGGVKAASFAALIKVLLTLNIDAVLIKVMPGQKILKILAILTMFSGNLIALYQTNIKRMLAYSSVAHAGYLLLGLLAGVAVDSGIPSPTDPQPVGAMMMYFIVYSAATVGAFGIIALLAKKGEERVNVNDFSGMANQHPWLAVAMMLFMVSLAGIPPTAGFVGKYFLFKEVLLTGENIGANGNNPYLILVVLAVVNSVASVYYYLKVVVAMYMKPDAGEFAIKPARASVIALTVAVFITLHAGILPGRYIGWSQKAGAEMHKFPPKQKVSPGNKLAIEQIKKERARKKSQAKR